MTPLSSPTIAELLREIEAQLAAFSLRATLGPALSEARVCAVEEQHRVRLPEDYRAFVTTLGDGGPGPYCGLMSLDESLGWDGDLASPSPLDPAQDYWAAWAKEEEAGRGALPIVHTGCGEMIWLVVSGVALGRLYFGTGLPHFADDAGFLHLYLRWLGDVRAARAGEETPPYFDFRVPRSEAELLLGAHAGLPEPQLVDLLEGIARVGPTARALPLAEESAKSDRARVRAAAERVLGKVAAGLGQGSA